MHVVPRQHSLSFRFVSPDTRLSLQYPYPHEQVGKAGLDVPSSVLNGPLLHDTILVPGDVLYMPRGLVHEAHTSHEEYSFHVTIALPTHDWTLATAVTRATQEALSTTVNYRMAMPVSLFADSSTTAPNNNNNNDNSNVELVQRQLEDALQLVREQVTVDSIVKDLQEKTKRHNERALQKRMCIIQRQQQQHETANHNKNSMSTLIGQDAAETVMLDTIVRASTLEEKAQVVLEQPRGLHVRQDTADALLGVLQTLKADPLRSCQVSDLLSLLSTANEASEDMNEAMDTDKICPLTLLSFARCTVLYRAGWYDDCKIAMKSHLLHYSLAS